MKELSEAQKDHAYKAMQGARPKKHSGVKHYRDYYTCGSCGAGVDVYFDYCFKCGYRILWSSPRCLSGEEDMDDGK